MLQANSTSGYQYVRSDLIIDAPVLLLMLMMSIGQETISYAERQMIDQQMF